METCSLCCEGALDYTFPCCGAETHQACVLRLRQDACPFCREPLDVASLGERAVKKARKRQWKDNKKENDEATEQRLRLEREYGLAPGSETAELALCSIIQFTSIPRLISYQSLADFQQDIHPFLHRFGDLIEMRLDCRVIDRFLTDIWRLIIRFRPKAGAPVDQQILSWILEHISVPGPALLEMAMQRFNIQMDAFAWCYAEAVRITMGVALAKGAFTGGR